jgi:hypothetical protein
VQVFRQRGENMKRHDERRDVKEDAMPAKFSLATVETVKQDLESLPEIDREVSLQKTIQTLAPSLRKLRASGYPMARIVEILKERGIRISDTTLSQYLRNRRSGSGKRTTAANTTAPSANMESAAASTLGHAADARESSVRKPR